MVINHIEKRHWQNSVKAAEQIQAEEGMFN